jgi:hypothetical protein
MDLATWTFLALVSWVPPEQHAYYERQHVTEARYWRVAAAIATAAAEAPLDGDAAWTAALLASTVAAESYVRADVVECRKSGYGGSRPALGAFQLVAVARVACELDVAARAAREVLRGAFEVCKGPPADRMAWYLSGHCDRGLGQARWRYKRALRCWLERRGEVSRLDGVTRAGGVGDDPVADVELLPPRGCFEHDCRVHHLARLVVPAVAREDHADG